MSNFNNGGLGDGDLQKSKEKQPDTIIGEHMVKLILNTFKSQFKKIGWVMEYEFDQENNYHVFYTYKKGTDKKMDNWQTCVVVTPRVIKYFQDELLEAQLKETLTRPYYPVYDITTGWIKAIFFLPEDKEAYELHLNK